MSDWMIYGVTGYTGRLIAAHAKELGLRPTLAGRSAAAVEALGRELDLPTRVFDLSAPDLAGMRLVLHCAGPFSATFKPMLDACLAAKAHYLDITGEVEVFEQLFQRDAELKAAGIAAVSGMGFDVVPTDCLAALLARELPGATRLELALKAPLDISPGTAKSMIEGLAKPGWMRRDGQLVQASAGERTRMVRFGDRPALAVAVGLGDVVTAYHSTGIPTIETFVRADVGTAVAMRVATALSPLLSLSPVQAALKQLAGHFAKGPSADARETTRSVVWGRVETAAESLEMRLQVPEAYALTAATTVAAVRRWLTETPPPGASTPSRAFGADFVLQVPGVSLERLPA